MVALFALTLGAGLAAENGAPDLRIRPDDGAGFRYDTGVLAGRLREDGKSLGLSGVVYLPTGLALTQTKLNFGLLSFYRIFAGNRRYGRAAWEWDSQARLLEDGSLETLWPAAPDRPFDLVSTYRWRGPSTVDLETTVRARERLPGFEAFVASYFAEPFTPATVFARDNGEPRFTVADEAHGHWQIFPRDGDALALIQSGRWAIPPNPIAWVIRPNLAEPIVFRKDPGSGVAVVLMAPAADCIAIAAPRGSDWHYSTYISLFGRTIEAGQEARARVRLVVTSATSAEDLRELYRAYLRDIGDPR